MKVIDKKRIYDRHFKLDEHTIEKNGQTSKYATIEFKEAALIFAVKDNKIILIDQYRYPTNMRLLEIPAGTIEEGETLEQCAKREFTEETGFIADEFKEFSRFYVMPSTTDYMDVIFFANVSSESKQNLDNLEDINVVLIDKEEYYKKIMNGEIKDAKTIIAFFIAREKGLI